ncbi:putative N-acetylglucosaminyl-phosphatidylinositol de-N-acetylase [Neolecta irregularis DAH-3]|uniref:N-acetylglucosaminylphosphatidylinositol deacetylase n=1 Tax=Neolecta irregularis (strain DAH-3) TaxID=1198029 RepID=A0A1U7LGG8_NEOID|nr:putative N-acetylglucosaminyl-phosphatidylinositol de-N-acetylase [Neolecta irregularis DAH-3]|eukprot:OLL21718.1 putative N-acetylglucosaminyl-phosphatidylinositol de-N-acetylase [Neolecta irregularis DAH-3]
MFFGPTLLNLQHTQISILCLSNGDDGGLGSIRQVELRDAAGVLGINSIKVINDQRIPDGMNVTWDKTIIQEYLAQYRQSFDFDTILTFDQEGVSSHLNHISLFQASLDFCKMYDLGLYTLRTVAIYQKYLGAFDILFSTMSSDLTFVNSPVKWYTGVCAMRRHKSQMVWFRWGWVTLSRYMYVNTISKRL